MLGDSNSQDDRRFEGDRKGSPLQYPCDSVVFSGFRLCIGILSLLCIASRKFVLLTEDMTHGVTDLSEGGVGFDGGDNQRKEVGCACRALFQGCQCLLHLLIVASLAQLSQFGRLQFAYSGIDAKQIWVRFVL